MAKARFFLVRSKEIDAFWTTGPETYWTDDKEEAIQMAKDWVGDDYSKYAEVHEVGTFIDGRGGIVEGVIARDTFGKFAGRRLHSHYDNAERLVSEIETK